MIKLKRTLVVIAIVGIAAALPLYGNSNAFADSCTPPTSLVGVHRPVGADAWLFSYNCSTGLWVSPHYSYDPNTGVYTPVDPVVYTYDSSTAEYTYQIWVYDAASRSYVQQTQSTANPPAGADIVGGPSAINNATVPQPTNTGDSSNGSTPATSGTQSGGSQSGANSGNTTTNATLTNTLNSQSSSGQASVSSNDLAGNATTGNANTGVTSVNTVQSSNNSLGGSTVLFNANVNGNVNGNLVIDPTSSTQTTNPSAAANTTVNNATNASITNNITAGSTSGDAVVSGNDQAGNATTGDATTIAEVINIIDSAISTGHSFIGVININGNLNGNILIPASLVDQLIADGTPTVNVTTTLPVSVIENLVTMGIINNVSENASSGNAQVSNNDLAGSAISGDATATITAFNLTGSNVIGGNVLFVFVNVVGGKWVGFILNAPAGTTAAELGSGNVTTTNATAANVNNTTNANITNNIELTAATGNATVDHNLVAGSATTGNASTGLDLLNIADSNLVFSGWFGLLFINVFGTWIGNFGIYYPPTVSSQSSISSSNTKSSTPTAVMASYTTGNGGSGSGGTFYTVETLSGYPQSTYRIVPVTMTGTYTTTRTYYTSEKVPIRTTATDANQHKSSIDWLLVILSIAGYGLFLAGDRLYVSRKRRNSVNVK